VLATIHIIKRKQKQKEEKIILCVYFFLIDLISFMIHVDRSTDVIQGVCSSSHETYVIDGSSILGKYNRAAVAVDNIECSRIGKQILEQNGTTMDAALAAAICNGVMNAHSMGIGGGCVITVYSK